LNDGDVVRYRQFYVVLSIDERSGKKVRVKDAIAGSFSAVGDAALFPKSRPEPPVGQVLAFLVLGRNVVAG
jgi:hypothetical protein